MLHVVQQRIEVARCRNQVALCKRLFAVARRFLEEIQPDKTLLAPVSHRIVERILLRRDNVNFLRIVARIGEHTVNRRQLLTGQAVCLDADKNGIRAVNIVLCDVGTVFYRVIQTRRVNKDNALGERQILERNLDFLYEIVRCRAGGSPLANFLFQLFSAARLDNNRLVSNPVILFLCRMERFKLFEKLGRTGVLHAVPEFIPVCRRIKRDRDLIGYVAAAELCQRGCLRRYLGRGKLFSQNSVDERRLARLDRTDECNMKFRLFTLFEKSVQLLGQPFGDLVFQLRLLKHRRNTVYNIRIFSRGCVPHDFAVQPRRVCNFLQLRQTRFVLLANLFLFKFNLFHGLFLSFIVLRYLYFFVRSDCIEQRLLLPVLLKAHGQRTKCGHRIPIADRHALARSFRRKIHRTCQKSS